MRLAVLKYRLSLLGLNPITLSLLIPAVIAVFVFIFLILNKILSIFEAMIIAFLLAFTPYSVLITILERRKLRYEREFADFLFELSELVRGGIDPLRAIKVLSERDLGSITKFVRIASRQTELGLSFERAMKNLANLLKSSLIANYAELVIQASYTGGAISSLIQKASSDMKTIIAIEEEKRAGLRQYMVIFYFAHVILLAICITMVIQFLPGLTQLGGFGFSPMGMFSQIDLNVERVSESLFHLSVINALFGGLMVGKISSGSIRHGLKHSLILVLLSYIAWNSFTVSTNSGYDLEIVSKPDQLYLGLPSEEIVFKVKNAKGEPVKDAVVVFKINKGKVIPETALTDKEGLCSVKAIPEGEEEGFYEITAKVGEVSKRIVLPAVEI